MELFKLKCFLGGLIGPSPGIIGTGGFGGRIPFGPVPCVGPCLPDCSTECINSYLISVRGGISNSICGGGCIPGGGKLKISYET